jgi:hypothetical protein
MTPNDNNSQLLKTRLVKLGVGRWALGVGRRSYSTSFSCVSSDAILSDRRNRRSFALISNARRCGGSAVCGCGAAAARASAPGWVRLTADDRLERHSHLKSRRARAFATGLHPGILTDRGSNGVG